MGRDLLYKPPVPTKLPDEDGTETKAKGPKSREIGRVGESIGPEVKPKEAPRPAAKPKAFQAAYFNKDISGVRQTNLRAKSAAALRGGEEATDLKKIVIPGALGIDVPEPARLREAIDLMGLGNGFQETLAGLLNRQGSWTKQEGVTAEMIEERMAQLEQMVEARKVALARMAKGGRAAQPASSVTVERAAEGAGLDGVEDVANEGTELVRKTAEQAEGMHRRIAKMLGIKIES